MTFRVKAVVIRRILFDGRFTNEGRLVSYTSVGCQRSLDKVSVDSQLCKITLMGLESCGGAYQRGFLHGNNLSSFLLRKGIGGGTVGQRICFRREPSLHAG